VRRRSVAILAEVAVPFVLVALWWFLSAGSTSLYFPPLARILSSVQHVWLAHRFSSDLVPSLENLAAGLLISTILGIAVGLLLGRLPVLSDAVTPVLEFLRAIPAVALLPAAVLLLGIGPDMRISVIVYGTIWPILLNTADGARSLDPMLADVVAAYHIRPRDRLRSIILPAASPQIVAGVRTALSVGITTLILSEMIGSTSGIGYQILSAQQSFAVSDMWAGIVVLGIIGYLLNVAFRGLEAYVLRWHRGMRQPVGS